MPTIFSATYGKMREQKQNAWEQYGNTFCSLHHLRWLYAVEKHIDHLALGNPLLLHACVCVDLLIFGDFSTIEKRKIR